MKPSGLLFCGALLVAVSPVQAYRYNKCMGVNVKQPSSSITFQAAKNSFPSGHSRRDALDAVRLRWNENPGNISINSIQYGALVETSNGENEIWYTNSESIMSGFPALAKRSFQCYWFFGVHTKIKEVDIIFDNDDYNWGQSRTKDTKIVYGGSWLIARTTMAHEMGHAVGLNHSNTRYNLMGSDNTHVHANANKIRAYIGEDSGNGAVFLYGTRSGTLEDVSVSHWKYDGKSGEYSTHTRTGVYNPTQGNLFQSSNVGGEPRYNVAAGGQVHVQFSYENNGKNLQSPNIRFYTSSNDNITTSDNPIATRTLSLGRNTVYTAKHLVTIPCSFDLWDNTYLGVIVDYDGAIGEEVENNNATYVRLRIVNKLNQCLEEPPGEDKSLEIDEGVVAGPVAFRLHQNEPNPFNPHTLFRLTLPTPGDYTLSIYDVAGRLVRRFAGSSGIGDVAISWDGTDTHGARVAAGLYVYAATAGGVTETRKLAVVR